MAPHTLYPPPVAAFVAAAVQSLCPSPSVSSPSSASPYPPSQADHKVPPQPGPSPPPVVAAAPQQRVVELGCCGDIDVQAAQEGVALAAAHVVVGCTHSDAPPQTGPRDDLDSEGPHMGRGEGFLGTPGRDIDLLKVSLFYQQMVVVTHASINFGICE